MSAKFVKYNACSLFFYENTKKIVIGLGYDFWNIATYIKLYYKKRVYVQKFNGYYEKTKISI